MKKKKEEEERRRWKVGYWSCRTFGNLKKDAKEKKEDKGSSSSSSSGSIKELWGRANQLAGLKKNIVGGNTAILLVVSNSKS